MAVHSIVETRNGTSITDSLDEYGNLITEMVSIYEVVCDEDTTNPAQDRLDILNHASCPVAGSYHSLDNWLKCESVGVTHKAGKTYTVTANYKSIGDPVLLPPVIEYDHQLTSEQIDKDINDNPLQVSSGEPLDPPLNEDFADRVIRYTFYVYTYDSDVAEAYINRVNDAPYAGFAEKTIKIGKFSGSPEFIGGYMFYRVIVELVVRADTWKRRCLDQGFRELTTGTPGFKAIADDEGQPVTEPVKLDGSGHILAASGTPHWHQFDTKQTANFLLLPINPLLIT